MVHACVTMLSCVVHPTDDTRTSRPIAPMFQSKSDIRYLIALAPPPEFRVTAMVLATGAEINAIFGVSPTATIKYQLGISKQWRDAHAGQILVSGKAIAF